MYNDAQYSRTPEYYEELKRKDRNKLIIAIVIIIIVAAGITGLVLGVFVSPFVVTGPSMFDTLIDGERIFVQKALYSINVGDIMVFKAPDNGDRLIKRVMAKPGDTVKASRSGSSSLYVNGIAVHHAYFQYAGSTTINDVDIVLGENEYFMMGDNYVDSKDSRIFGVVTRDKFIGKCISQTKKNN